MLPGARASLLQGGAVNICAIALKGRDLDRRGRPAGPAKRSRARACDLDLCAVVTNAWTDRHVSEVKTSEVSSDEPPPTR